jgi:hypothetical protein
VLECVLYRACIPVPAVSEQSVYQHATARLLETDVSFFSVTERCTTGVYRDGLES